MSTWRWFRDLHPWVTYNPRPMGLYSPITMTRPNHPDWSRMYFLSQLTLSVLGGDWNKCTDRARIISFITNRPYSSVSHEQRANIASIGPFMVSAGLEVMPLEHTHGAFQSNTQVRIRPHDQHFIIVHHDISYETQSSPRACL